MSVNMSVKTPLEIKITTAIFEAGLKCPNKCFLRSHDETGLGNGYADWLRIQTDAYNNEGIKVLMARAEPNEFIIGPLETGTLKTAKWRRAVNFVAHAHNLESSIYAVERVPPEGRGKSAQFIPIRFVFSNKLSRDDKILLAFDALVLIRGDGH